MIKLSIDILKLYSGGLDICSNGYDLLKFQSKNRGNAKSLEIEKSEQNSKYEK